MLQRAEYARRYAEAERMGLKCVLLYCGDHDPDGLRISDTLRKNLADLQDVVWTDGTEGYDPTDLIIDRFGLQYDFIQRNNLTWIDNLITGSGKDLADPKHPNFSLPYLVHYKQEIGIRKCEANSIVVIPEKARALMEEAILNYLGEGADERFNRKVELIRAKYNDFISSNGLDVAVNKVLEQFNDIPE